MKSELQFTMKLLVAATAILVCAPRCLAIDLGDIDSRIKKWGDDILNAQARPLIVTASSPPAGGDRLSIPGDPASSGGIDVDGVARLFIDVDPAAGVGGLCSGSLLGDGQHVLTAAHCVTEDDGSNAVIDGADGNSVTFETSTGNVTIPFLAADVQRHPSYDGNFLHGFDVAVIDLGSVVDPAIPRYQLNSNLGIEASPHLSVGYGRSGDGNTGASSGAGSKRSGDNNYESIGLPVSQIENLDTQLTADFDSGDAANDAFEVFFNFTGAINSGLGFGSDEVGTAPGDSGGPSFVLDGGVPVIAGVHSYGLQLTLLDGTTSDVDATLNSSFGEFYVDARIADPEVRSFINGVIGVPEPRSLALLCVCGVVLMSRRK